MIKNSIHSISAELGEWEGEFSDIARAGRFY